MMKVAHSSITAFTSYPYLNMNHRFNILPFCPGGYPKYGVACPIPTYLEVFDLVFICLV